MLNESNKSKKTKLRISDIQKEIPIMYADWN
jgi:hypothetical protein